MPDVLCNFNLKRNFKTMKVCAVIAAGGRGRRMGADINKVFLPLAGKEIIAHTLAAFEACGDVDAIVVVTGKEDIARVTEIAVRDRITKLIAAVEGGAERQESVYKGLLAASGDLVAVHDGARCLITPAEISAVIGDARLRGAAAAGVTVKDTLKAIGEDGYIRATIDRNSTVQIQTPQVFPLDKLLKLHKRAEEGGIAVTDDCAIFEHYGEMVYVTRGSYDNIKLTTPEDIAVGEKILDRRNEQ